MGLNALAKYGDDVLDAVPQAPIHGKPQVTMKDGVPTNHGPTSLERAEVYASQPGVESVHLNQTVRTITKGKIDSSVRPDVGALRKDGKVDCCEVLSPGQTRRETEEKLRDALGEDAGDIDVTDPD